MKRKKKDSRYNPMVLNLLASYWKDVAPDQRFCQMVANLGRHLGQEDIFYIEDDKLIELLNKIDQGAKLLLKQYKEQNK